jgi:hypothetical protein
MRSLSTGVAKIGKDRTWAWHPEQLRHDVVILSTAYISLRVILPPFIAAIRLRLIHDT